MKDGLENGGEIMEIFTDRLLLRPFLKTDLDDVYEYCSQPGVGEMAGWPHHVSIDQTREMLDEWTSKGTRLAITLKEDGKVIGHIGISPDSDENREDTRELGCALNCSYHRKGFMTEAITAVVDSLFKEDIEYIWACCFQQNIPSKGMIEKVGFIFQQEGEFYAKKLDKEFKSYEYRISKDEWLKLKTKNRVR
jgi:ribosomal-protein-alanine N-acetyltransferase